MAKIALDRWAETVKAFDKIKMTDPFTQMVMGERGAKAKPPVKKLYDDVIMVVGLGIHTTHITFTRTTGENVGKLEFDDTSIHAMYDVFTKLIPERAIGQYKVYKRAIDCRKLWYDLIRTGHFKPVKD